LHRTVNTLLVRYKNEWVNPAKGLWKSYETYTGPTLCGTNVGFLALNLAVKVNADFTLEEAMKALSLDGGQWSAPPPVRFTPGRETRYPLHRGLGGPQRRTGRVWKTSLIPGFDLWTVHTVAIRILTELSRYIKSGGTCSDHSALKD
jgi:hypothetical protein